MPPRSVRRKRIPESAGAGFSDNVTFLPECRPIPAQVIDRFKGALWVHVASLRAGGASIRNESKRGAGRYSRHTPLTTSVGSMVYTNYLGLELDQRNPRMWLNSHSG